MEERKIVAVIPPTNCLCRNYVFCGFIKNTRFPRWPQTWPRCKHCCSWCSPLHPYFARFPAMVRPCFVIKCIKYTFVWCTECLAWFWRVNFLNIITLKSTVKSWGEDIIIIFREWNYVYIYFWIHQSIFSIKRNINMYLKIIIIQKIKVSKSNGTSCIK